MRSTLIAGALALAAIGVGASPAHAQIYLNVGTPGYNSGYYSGYSNGGLYSPFSYGTGYQSSYYGGSPYQSFGGYRQSTFGGYSPYSYGGYSPYSYGGYRSNYPSVGQQFYNGGRGFGGRRR